jgi:hypothetical protein
MRVLTDSEFLSAWEQGLEQLPFERALSLLERACPEFSAGELAALSIGRRDALLLALRKTAFGSRLQALSCCPRCQVRVEVDLDVEQLQVEPEPSADGGPLFSVGERLFRLRAPNSADLADSAGLTPDQAALRILSRCLDSTPESKEAGVQLSPGLVAQAAERIAALDPQADVQIELVCWACRQNWLERFDIVAFFWSELDAWARRMLREIHALASAYGWSESQILALTPLRRHFYLEMTHA